MSWVSDLAGSLRPPDPRPLPELEGEIVEELNFHIEMRALDNLRAGMAADEARQDALRRFGDFKAIHQACRRIQAGERIMLQRIQTLLIVVVVGAVVYLGVAHWQAQRANEAALEKMSKTLERIADNSPRSSSASPQSESVLATDLAARLAAAPPIVMQTLPRTGDKEVDPAIQEIRVTFSKEMADRSWSWCQTGEGNFPESTGEIHYLPDAKTCVMPVKLEAGKTYAIWLNSEGYGNFKDREGRSGIPYFLQFQTRK